MTASVRPQVAKGDRFRVRESFTGRVLLVGQAPSHTESEQAEIPAGMVVVADEPQPESTAFTAVPEDYETLKTVLISEQRRKSGKPYSYYLAFKYADIGTRIEPVT